MTIRKNPFRIIRIAAAAIAGTAFAAFVLFLIAAAIAAAVEESGPHVLWQLPLLVLALFGLVAFVAFIGSLIAELWRKAERRWDRKARS